MSSKGGAFEAGDKMGFIFHQEPPIPMGDGITEPSLRDAETGALGPPSTIGYESILPA